MTSSDKDPYSPLIKILESIIREAEEVEASSRELLEKIHPKYRQSAVNLLHYRVLRSRDLRKVQKKLGHMGLSRLAKSQSHVMASLKTNLSLLKAYRDQSPIPAIDPALSFKEGAKALKSNAKKLLGYRTKKRRTRIMVTMPTETAENYGLVKAMIEAGMNCARINCAHDTAEVWEKMIHNIRKASEELGRKCKVAMDLAGPKIRTGPIFAGPKVRKIKPQKNELGQVTEPATVWLGPKPHSEGIHVPIADSDLPALHHLDHLYFRDLRGKKRAFTHLYRLDDGYLAHCKATTFIETGMPLFSEKNAPEPLVRIGELPVLQLPVLIKEGDVLRLDKATVPGGNAVYDDHEEFVEPAHISCTSTEIFDQVAVGERILFDDGKISGRIEEVHETHLLIRINYAADGLAKLRSDKGINLPDSRLTISGLTEKDREDLKFVARQADVVNFSFVNRPEDVQELIATLDTLKARNKLGVILKIETQNGFNQLTDILLEAMQVYPVGVMIARGDLAIETGWNNIGRVQEEILSLSQAAHLTDIWATQVLEGLAKKGLPSRAEITDAVMAQRADCVMLNKGPFILDAIRLLDEILIDMEPYWEKNAPLSPMMMQAMGGIIN